MLRKKAAILLMICAVVAVFGIRGPVHAQSLQMDKGSATISPEVTSPEMRQLLPLIMQQLQNNPQLMGQFGLGGLGALNGLDGLEDGEGAPTGIGANGANGAAAIPGLEDAIAKALANQNAASAAATGIPEQVQIYRQQYHPIDMDHDGRISADEAAAYASWMFRRRDINGDSVLVGREFAAVEALPGSPDANRKRLRTESRRLELLFGSVDANSDKMISKDEFLEYAKAQFDEKRGNDPDIDPFEFQTVLPFQ
ncbi:hypothetical protein [Thalassospira australica]|uniref:hypothetical protein n=1 Tax=Thalassospira australica TaxID=1528106 RepID=UPI00384AAEA2